MMADYFDVGFFADAQNDDKKVKTQKSKLKTTTQNPKTIFLSSWGRSSLVVILNEVKDLMPANREILRFAQNDNFFATEGFFASLRMTISLQPRDSSLRSEWQKKKHSEWR